MIFLIVKKKSSFIFYLIAFFTGTILALMVFFNAALAERTTNLVSILFNHITGFVLVSLTLLIGYKNPLIKIQKKKAHWYQYFGGLFGLVILSLNTYTVKISTTTLAMAGSVLGQVTTGLVLDLTGAIWMEKRKISKRKMSGIIISFLGILFMLFYKPGESFKVFIISALLSFLAGILTMTQMVYNSALSKIKGTFFSAWQNVFSGLIGISLIFLIFGRGNSYHALTLIPNTPFFYIILGGTLGTLVVIIMNLVIPKIPGSSSSILLSSGQILSALALDSILASFSNSANPIGLGLIIGSGIMVIGIIIGG